MLIMLFSWLFSSSTMSEMLLKHSFSDVRTYFPDFYSRISSIILWSQLLAIFTYNRYILSVRARLCFIVFKWWSRRFVTLKQFGTGHILWRWKSCSFDGDFVDHWYFFCILNRETTPFAFCLSQAVLNILTRHIQILDVYHLF